MGTDSRGSFEEIRDRCTGRLDIKLHWIRQFLRSGVAEVVAEALVPADAVLPQIPIAEKSDLRCSGKLRDVSDG